MGKFGVKTTGRILIGSFLIGSFLKYFAMGPNVSATAYPSSEKQSVDRPHLAHFRFTSGMDTTSGPCEKLGHPGDILYILIQTWYLIGILKSFGHTFYDIFLAADLGKGSLPIGASLPRKSPQCGD